MKLVPLSTDISPFVPKVKRGGKTTRTVKRKVGGASGSKVVMMRNHIALIAALRAGKAPPGPVKRKPKKKSKKHSALMAALRAAKAPPVKRKPKKKGW